MSARGEGRPREAWESFVTVTVTELVDGRTLQGKSALRKNKFGESCCAVRRVGLSHACVSCDHVITNGAFCDAFKSTTYFTEKIYSIVPHTTREVCRCTIASRSPTQSSCHIDPLRRASWPQQAQGGAQIHLWRWSSGPPQRRRRAHHAAL